MVWYYPKERFSRKKRQHASLCSVTCYSNDLYICVILVMSYTFFATQPYN